MMRHVKKPICSGRKAVVLIISMIFIMVFSMFALSMAAMSGTSVEVSSNQHKINSALTAAQSGLEYGRSLVSSYASTITISPSDRTEITDTEADQIWSGLCSHVQANAINGAVVSDDNLVTSAINFGATDATFQVRFYRYDDDPCTIRIEGIGTIGTDEQVKKLAGINLVIKKNTEILKYAVASQCRAIVTGDSTIDGDIYSAWDKPNFAPPFELEQASTINGTLNTVSDINCFDPNNPGYVGYTLETLDENGDPMFDEDGNRIYSPADKVQGAYEEIKYKSEPQMAGFNYTDYDTSQYRSVTTIIPASGAKVWEYYPHKPGDYTQSGGFGSRHIQRNVYQNQTFTNRRLPTSRDALFKNCTFEGVFFVETNAHVGGWAAKYNNVRFEDCNFNGAIVTSVPDDFYGPGNSLYFTGSSLFNNTYMEEATILAPNFNVDIGNNQELEDESDSVLTGLVVGGIVDVRGNANINGTILSMYRPAGGWSSGVYASYATNVGFSGENPFESGVPEDIGTIHIHPDPDRMLPAGMKSNITIDPNQESYTEH